MARYPLLKPLFGGAFLFDNYALIPYINIMEKIRTCYTCGFFEPFPMPKFATVGLCYKFGNSEADSLTIEVSNTFPCESYTTKKCLAVRLKNLGAKIL